MSKLQIENVSKSFGKTKVLRNISLSIGKGIFGLLGPNGAGKTTLMKCILGLYQYEGKIGFEREEKAVDYEEGYLPQHFDALRELSVRECLTYIAHMKRCYDREEVERLIQMVNLQSHASKKMKQLSGGMRRRVGIAQALLGKPDLLIIDEPTAGLDPGERVALRNLLSDLSKDSVMIVSTHIVEDLEAIADHIGFLREGSILKEDSIHNLLQEMEGKVGEILVDHSLRKDYEEKYTVVESKQTSQGTLLRMIGEELPQGTTLLPATLQDAYFHIVGPIHD